MPFKAKIYRELLTELDARMLKPQAAIAIGAALQTPVETCKPLPVSTESKYRRLPVNSKFQILYTCEPWCEPPEQGPKGDVQVPKWLHCLTLTPRIDLTAA